MDFIVAIIATLLILISAYYWRDRQVTAHSAHSAHSATNTTQVGGFGRGPSGPQGSAGPAGPAGERGIPGIRGPVGPIGPKGDAGPPGSRGDQGPVGPEGPRGERGFDGFPGPAGSAGPRGETGPRGRDGKEGRRGAKGDAGPRGWPGLQGDPGTFGENSCASFGSDDADGWQCPDTFPVFSGMSIGQTNTKLYCSGGLAKNATCNGSSGTGARARTFVNSGKIVDIKISAGGRNYRFAPTVKVIAAKGYGAILKAEVSNGSVSNIVIVDGGEGYDDPPELQFETVDGGYGATASAIIDNSRVVTVNIIHTGQNYQVAPQVEFRGGGGTGARAVAEINEGHLISIRLTEGGAGYTYPPVIVITPGVSKAGCNFCHMCCKKNPKKGKDETLQKQYEDRLSTHETQIEKLQEMLQDQAQMVELAMRSGRKDRAEQQYVRKDILPPVATETRTGNQNDYQARRQAGFNNMQPQPQQEQQSQQERAPWGLNMSFGESLSSVTANIDSTLLGLAQGEGLANPRLMNNYAEQLAIQEYPADRLRNEQERQLDRAYKDWAHLGRAEQSTTFEGQLANNAIDGNLDTYNQTNIGSEPSWLQVTFPKLVELSKVQIDNRLGNFSIRERLVPFTVTIYNGNDAQVASKRFEGVQNQYVWDNVNVVAKYLKVTQESKAYLHVSNITAMGRAALSCEQYEARYQKYRDLADKDILSGKAANASETIRNRNYYKSLYASCSKLDKANAREQETLVVERAQQYNQIYQEQQEQVSSRIKAAQEQWSKVQAQLQKEADTAAQAKKLGLPPPPPLYSQRQVAKIQAQLAIKPLELTEFQKAQCMVMFNNALTARTKAEDLGRTAAAVPSLRDAAQAAGVTAEDSWNNYNKTCVGEAVARALAANSNGPRF